MEKKQPEHQPNNIDQLKRDFTILAQADPQNIKSIDAEFWLDLLHKCQSPPVKLSDRPTGEEKAKAIRLIMLKRTFQNLCHASGYDSATVSYALGHFIKRHEINNYGQGRGNKIKNIPQLTHEEAEILHRFGSAGEAFCEKMQEYDQNENQTFSRSFPIDPTLPVPQITDDGKIIG